MSVSMTNGVIIGRSFYVAKIINGNVEITNENYKSKFKINGIDIPYNLREQYGGKFNIRLQNDKYFSKAFIEIYYPQHLKKYGFQFIADKVDELTKEDDYLDTDNFKLSKN